MCAYVSQINTSVKIRQLKKNMSTLCLPHVSINCTLTAVCTSWVVFFFFHSSPPLLVVGCELYAQPASYKGVIILYRLSRLLQTTIYEACTPETHLSMLTGEARKNHHRYLDRNPDDTLASVFYLQRIPSTTAYTTWPQHLVHHSQMLTCDL